MYEIIWLQKTIEDWLTVREDFPVRSWTQTVSFQPKLRSSFSSSQPSAD